MGASGAIAAVLGGYLILYPRARVITVIPIPFFFRMVNIPAPIFLGLWFLMQLLNGTLALTCFAQNARSSGWRPFRAVAWPGGRTWVASWPGW